MEKEVREFLEALTRATVYKTWSAGEVIDANWRDEARELLDKFSELKDTEYTAK